MLNFLTTDAGVEIEYQEDYGGGDWVWNELKTKQEVRISQIFSFEPLDLLNPPTADQNFDGYKYRFRFGKFDDGYVKILARFIDIKSDLYISRDVKLKRSTFVAERNISIFSRLSNLLEHSNPIVIGGVRPGAIPKDEFVRLLKKFPTSHELKRYADSRVQAILFQYLDGMKDARGLYENYLNRKSDIAGNAQVDLNVLKRLEVEKYILIRDSIKGALDEKKNLPEREWQQIMLAFLLLLFPKYIKVLENVTINDYYSKPNKKTSRFIDIALVDSSGNLDVIEIKKPFENKILHKNLYRGNSIPTSELSGSIMQAEKYLFHLSKWGVQGEKALTEKYRSELPTGMNIRISNPKAIIIVGRDQMGDSDMNENQLLDFELIKRKYANMMDIITYDDLLRRLDNTIAALRS